MRKTFGILLGFMMAVTLPLIFASCGSSPTTPPKPTPTPTPSYSTSAVTVISAASFQPFGIAWHGGNYWVTNDNGGALEEFGSTFSQSVSTTNDGTGAFSSPFDVKVGPDGTVYVADYGNGQIEFFSSTGTYQGLIPSLASVLSMQVNSAGTTLYVLLNAPAIETYLITAGSPNSYTYETTFATTSSGVGVLSAPQFLALDSANNVYVTNFSGHDIAKYGPTGASPVSFGSAALTGPNGIVVDGSGNVLVTQDNASGFIQEFNPSGSTYAAGVTFGNSVLNDPYDLALDGSGNLYVTNSSAGNVLEFKNNY
jgi:streptogramin lyase